MNQVTLLGRMVREPECKTLSNGKCMTTFSLAVQRDYKNAEGKYDADFINCTAFGKTAEIIGNYIKKGQRVIVEGAIQTSVQTANDGTKRFYTNVSVSKIEFIEKKESNQQGGFDDFGTPQSDAGGFGG